MNIISKRQLLKTIGGVSALNIITNFLPNNLANANNASKHKTWDFLKPGDIIDVVAPSSPVDNPQDRYKKIKKFFETHTNLKVRIPRDLIEPTKPLDEANTIKQRAKFVIEAFNSNSKAVWAIGGGGWGTSILQTLANSPKPQKVKPILGYSDTTALHILANQFWGFPSIHSVALGINKDISPGWNKNGLTETLNMLTGKVKRVKHMFTPLNQSAKNITSITTKIVGGNSLLISALNGSSLFTLDTRGKFLFMESIADDPGRFSRKLIGLAYSPIIKNCSGIIFGDIIQDGGRPNPKIIEDQFNFIIKRFANKFAVNKPVLMIKNTFGHGSINRPLPFNTKTNFQKVDNKILGIIYTNKV